MILTFILFFIIVLGLSFLTDLILGKNKSDIYEQFFMRIGIGLAYYTILGIIMDFLFIPLNIWIITVVSIAIPAYYVHKNKINISKIKWKNYFKLKGFRQPFYYIIVFLMFLVTAQMYIGGSLSYSYFENGDPWGYAMVSKQISLEQTIKAPYNYNHYSEPYTQGYQIVMGTLHQSNDSIYLTMKIFHNLIISFSILWFFFFAKELFNKRSDDGIDIAFFSTFALFAIPSWVSHFVFSLHYNMVLIPIFLYSLFKMRENIKWKYIAGLIYGSIILNHFFTALMVTVMIFFYYFLKVIFDAKFNKEILQVFFYGVITSLFFYIPTNIRHSDYFFTYIYESHGGLEMVLKPLVPALSNITGVVATILGLGAIGYLYKKSDKWFKPIGKQLSKTSVKLGVLALTYAAFIVTFFLEAKSLVFVKGSASRPYFFHDFFNSTSANMINNPVGWGTTITFLTVLSLVFILIFKNINLIKKEKNFDLFFSVNFFLFFLYLTLGMTHAVAFVPFRQWTFLALFVALMAGYIMGSLFNLKDNYSKAQNFILISVVSYGILFGIFSKISDSVTLENFITIFIISIVLGLISSKFVDLKNLYSKSLSTILKTVMIVFLLFFILQTSFSAKYEFNHDLQWSDYQIFVPQSFPLYDWIRENLPKDTNVVNICKSSEFLISYGMLPPVLDRDFNAEFRKDYDGNYNRLLNDRFFTQNLSNEEIHTILSEKNIEYFTLGASCLGRRPNANLTDFQNKITRIAVDEDQFTIVQATETELLFKVN